MFVGCWLTLWRYHTTQLGHLIMPANQRWDPFPLQRLQTTSHGVRVTSTKTTGRHGLPSYDACLTASKFNNIYLHHSTVKWCIYLMEKNCRCDLFILGLAGYQFTEQHSFNIYQSSPLAWTSESKKNLPSSVIILVLRNVPCNSIKQNWRGTQPITSLNFLSRWSYHIKSSPLG